MNFHSNPLPSAEELAGMLMTHSLAEVSASLGFERKAITTKLRRHGLALGKPTAHYVMKNRNNPPVLAAPLRKEKAFHADRVTRITFAGAEVTMPRLTFLDGEASA
jgi:hypothetical protein